MEMADSILLQISQSQVQLAQTLERIHSEQNQRTFTVTSPTVSISSDNGEPVRFDTDSRFQQFADDSFQRQRDQFSGRMVGMDSPSISISQQVFGPENPPPLPGSLSNLSQPNTFGQYTNHQNHLQYMSMGTLDQVKDMFINDGPNRVSVEKQELFFSEHRRAFQERFISGSEKIGEAVSTVGGFLMPGGFLVSAGLGLGVGAAATGLIHTAAKETRTALDYQELLEKKAYTFINPYEATNEYGAGGFSLSDRQDISQYLRHAATDNFLSDPDIKTILEGSIDGKLLKSVSDVESFKKKFDSIISAVKKIAVTMDQSLEESMKFMGEMERRGIKVQDMAHISSEVKVSASMLGMKADEIAPAVLENASALTQGTGINTAKVVEGSNNNMFVSGLVAEMARDTNELVSNYIKNSGGAAQVGAQVALDASTYLTQQGSGPMLGLLMGATAEKDENGNWRVNQNKLQDILTPGKYTEGELNSMREANLRAYTSEDQMRLIKDQSRLVGDYFQGVTGQQAIAKIAELVMQGSNGQIKDISSALIAMGYTDNTAKAEFAESFLSLASDPSVNGSYMAKVAADENANTARANYVSVFERMFHPFAEAADWIGDKSQGATDAFSRHMEGYHDIFARIDSRKAIGGRADYDLTLEGTLKEIGNENEALTAFLKEREVELRKQKDEAGLFAKAGLGEELLNVRSALKQTERGEVRESNKYLFDTMEFQEKMIEEGKYSAADLANLKRTAEDESKSAAERESAQALLEYQQSLLKNERVKESLGGGWIGGALSTAGGWIDNAKLAGKQLSLDYKYREADNIESGKFWLPGGDDLSGKALDDALKSYENDRQKILNKQKDLFSRRSLDESTAMKLDFAVRAGNVEEVKRLAPHDTEMIALAEQMRQNDLKNEQALTVMDHRERAAQQGAALASSAFSIRDFVLSRENMSFSERAALEDRVDPLMDLARKYQKKAEKMSPEEKGEYAIKMATEMSHTFDGMSNEDMLEYANKLVKQSGGTVSLDSLLSADGTTVDQAAFMSAFVKQYENMNNDVTQKDGKVEGKKKKDTLDSKEAQRIVDEAHDYMRDTINKWREERQMWKDAYYDRPVTNISSTQNQ